jgi:aspartate carbamoyltransferase regulatory subunit
MLTSREYIGLSLEGDFLKIARVKPNKKGLQLIRLDKLKLVEPIRQKEKPAVQPDSPEDVFAEDDSDADSIFGLDDLDDDESDELAEIDLSSIDADEDEDAFGDPDLVEEASVPRTNEEMLVRYLDDFQKKRVMLGLNVESGNTIYQIIKNTNFKELKKKEVEDNVQEKLHAIYGTTPSKDYYDYLIRDNGSLVIASIDDESPTLGLVSRTLDMFERNFYINDVIPDEVAMIGLFRNHYSDQEGQITGLIQFGPNKCRMVFMQGHEVLQVSPVINEGTANKNFLNTIFSKILFQLDTGEIPGVDRLILFNNNIGDKATDFFRSNFPDLGCENFTFNPELFNYDESVKDLVPAFTTAIGVAATAAGVATEKYPKISFLPEYIDDKQKIFKLQWHGVVLLILIGISPVVLNHFYQKNAAQIDQLQSQANRTQTAINDLQPLVQESEMLSAQIGELQGQLSLLTDLSRDNIRWTVTLDRFNQAVERVGGLWVNSFRQNNDVLMVDGYSLTRERIPTLANQFPNVTLLSVRREEIRERDVFYFNMMIRRVVEDENEFTPSSARGIDELMN